MLTAPRLEGFDDELGGLAVGSRGGIDITMAHLVVPALPLSQVIGPLEVRLVEGFQALVRKSPSPGCEG